MTGFMNSTSTVLTTSYLSKPNVLTEIHQQFSSMEQGLQDELESVEENYPGYDEYIVNKEEILVIIPMSFYPTLHQGSEK